MSTTEVQIGLEEKLRSEITAEVTTALEKEYADKLKQFQDRLTEDTNKAVQKSIEEWKQDQIEKELTDDELEKLLTQEYATFQVKVKVLGDNDDYVDRDFTLRELPQSLEKKFVRMATQKLKPQLKNIAGLAEKVMEGSVATKLETIMDSIEPSFDVLAETVQIILNPFSKITDVTVEWIQSNISTRRQFEIVQAQERLNGLRNFFSPAFLSTQAPKKR